MVRTELQAASDPKPKALEAKVSIELKNYANSIICAINSDEHELDKFWLKRSKKLVLSVLAVRRQSDGKIQFFRGMNVEVSLSAGSLCAERNAISTAVASNPLIKREDLLVIGTVMLDLKKFLGLSLPGNMMKRIENSSQNDNRNPLWPCGVCSEWLRKITANSKHCIKVLAFKDARCEEYYSRDY